MKVKELKAILANFWDENATVHVCDVDHAELDIVECRETNGNGFGIFVRQEFPDAWFDQNGNEMRWIKGEGVSLNHLDGEISDISLTNSGLFDDKEEHILTFEFHDGVANCKDHPGIRMVYPKLSELTDEQIEAIDEYVGGRCIDSGCVTPNDICLFYGAVEYLGLMFTDNGHDNKLVEEINEKWLKAKDKFKPILIALYTRDIDEITDSDAFKIPKWLEFPEYSTGCDLGVWDAYNKRCLDDMVERWDLFADNYLEHIADDQDLKTILTFVRYDVCEDYS